MHLSKKNVVVFYSLLWWVTECGSISNIPHRVYKGEDKYSLKMLHIKDASILIHNIWNMTVTSTEST